MSQVVAATKLIEELEKKKEKGSVSTVRKIKEAIEKHRETKELLVIAIDLSSKKMKINSNKIYEAEIPVQGSYKETYLNLINSLSLSGKNKDEVEMLRKKLMGSEVYDKIETEKYVLLEDSKPYMEVVIDDTRYMDFGKIKVDLAS